MDGTDRLLGIAEELYALLPGEFTGTRNQWAKQTRAGGDPELARRITALRRPSVAAWVVNTMMRQQADQMSGVLDLGAALRQAQDDLDADALRDLTRQRRQLTTAVTHEGRELARALGQKVTEAVADQVRDTLHAAMVDAEAAAAVRSGLLVSALAATGVGPADVVDAVAVPEAIGLSARARTRSPPPRSRLRVVPESGGDAGGGAAAVASATGPGRRQEDRGREERAREERERDERERDERRRAAQEAVEAARTAADDADRRRRKARKREAKLQARTLQTADELEQARRRAAELEHELDTLGEAAVDAAERRAVAEQRYAAAQEALAEARARLPEG